MVSTRGIRYKFSEGERVLCYEPDPTKAKVLYDSKVLEVIESKDKRGRRTVEYLIHFQGWNSSWDRCVSEDFVLKDTEQNRQLQRDLAEKSQLQLGAYLYRRERKKPTAAPSSSNVVPAKRARNCEEGSFTSGTASEEFHSVTESEVSDTDSSSRSGGNVSTPPPANVHQGRAHITLPSQLRDRLTFDYHLVVKRGRLSRLPATPCVADILDNFVQWFARSGVWITQRGARNEPPPRPDIYDVTCRLNMVREVADGIRAYFDSVLRGHLLYKQELNQYHTICGNFIALQIARLEASVKQEAISGDDEPMGGACSPQIPEYSHLPPYPDNMDQGIESAAQVVVKRETGVSVPVEAASPPINENRPQTRASVARRQSNKEEAKAAKPETKPAKPEVKTQFKGPSMLMKVPVKVKKEPNYDEVEANMKSPPEYSHLPPYPVKTEPGLEGAEMAAPDVEESKTERALKVDRPPAEENHAPNNRQPRNNNIARRLRSQSSNLSVPESDGGQSPVRGAAEHRALETPPFSEERSGSSSSEGWYSTSAAPPATVARSQLSQLLDKVAKWRVIQREGTEHRPCRVYGAIHLARLFVKLPDFLNATHMPDSKLKSTLKNIDLFVQYLNEHGEWFGESYYVADNASRSQ